MTGQTCVICGGRADHGHHVTGRGHDRAQQNDELVVPLCQCDHDLVHEDLRHQGIDRPPTAPLNVLETIERCLRRAALFLGRIAEERTEAIWAVLTDTVAGWANSLRSVIAVLDRDLPAWRTIPEIEP